MAIKLIDFWAPWCSPCQAMKPVIEELHKELDGKVEIVEVNVDENPTDATKYGVMSIPTYIILKDDKEVGRKIGYTSKADLLKLIAT
ncbi:MAG: Thioredoxin [Candidatus Daviesbacteria bacterium GW2011_GWA1_41_61]|uniref:Thioredoxin n=1 Tax=Candidatus Daviesbacteria bacterium GW2011_GWA2_40_9 TaxID=1618424 RepID=A0A0G0U847_9BACT|nr:MAG: Thioredoxin [Candidatus Daviesbacteria bacterium GW2011_GWC1_40_9]KKR83446.1 MAG: Thioredoxin [Candidatus Daviesbacteria bacterium GW2011_GWA2_40_9]KKR93828.1 MAG: Thioredoxin [Candidatus Daviesbacteria bacterium GW2011_GWB1_41_15]KKS15294.1 MAG: Thioredoxin [Candidatus Daviesbacteria bacterium GW2011_GWA1_41_61]